MISGHLFQYRKYPKAPFPPFGNMEQNRSLAAHGIHRIFQQVLDHPIEKRLAHGNRHPMFGKIQIDPHFIGNPLFPYNLTIGGQPRANLPAGDPWRNRSSRNAGQSSPSDARPCRFRTIERDRYLSASKTRSTRPTMKSAFPTGVPSPWTIPPTPGSAALSTNCEGRRTPAR